MPKAGRKETDTATAMSGLLTAHGVVAGPQNLTVFSLSMRLDLLAETTARQLRFQRTAVATGVVTVRQGFLQYRVYLAV